MPIRCPEIYDVLKTKKDDIFDNQTWNRRYKEYMDKLKTGSLFDVAEVFRDLFLFKTGQGSILWRAQTAGYCQKPTPQRALHCQKSKRRHCVGGNRNPV